MYSSRRAELDREYIRCWSIGLDIYILYHPVEAGSLLISYSEG